jgi:hypothetical protein
MLTIQDQYGTTFTTTRAVVQHLHTLYSTHSFGCVSWTNTIETPTHIVNPSHVYDYPFIMIHMQDGDDYKTVERLSWKTNADVVAHLARVLS